MLLIADWFWCWQVQGALQIPPHIMHMAADVDGGLYANLAIKFIWAALNDKDLRKMHLWATDWVGME